MLFTSEILAGGRIFESILMDIFRFDANGGDVGGASRTSGGGRNSRGAPSDLVGATSQHSGIVFGAARDNNCKGCTQATLCISIASQRQTSISVFGALCVFAGVRLFHLCTAVVQAVRLPGPSKKVFSALPSALTGHKTGKMDPDLQCSTCQAL
jgi:hypothetical protein